MTKPVIKIGIIGGGFGVVGLLPAFASVKNCKVVATANTRKEWRALLARGDLGAVAIAVPPAAQYRIAKAALKKGLHVFAEKPLAANVKQAKELVALAKQKKVVHGIDFMFPQVAQWQKVKELLDAKALGNLAHVSVQWDWQSGDIKFGRDTWRTRVRQGGGALAFYFSHGLNYLEHFAGTIQDADVLFTHSPKSLGGGEVGFEMLLKFKSGASGAVHVSCNSPGFVRHRLVFYCERGEILLENKNAIVDNFSVKTYDQNGETVVKVKKDTGKKGEDERVKAVRKLAQKFIDACAHTTQMSPSFIDGARVQELVEKIRRK